MEDVHCTLKDIKIHQRSGPFLTHLALAFSSWAYVVSIKILTHDDIYKYKILLVCHLNVKYKYFFLGNWGTRGWEDCWNDIESIWTGRVASSMWRTQRKRRKMEAKNPGPSKNVSRSGKIFLNLYFFKFFNHWSFFCHLYEIKYLHWIEISPIDYKIKDRLNKINFWFQ